MLKICFFIMMLVCALISTVLYTRIEKKEAWLHYFLFFYFDIIFIISGIKWFLGSADNSLSQSLWDTVPKTFLHYGPILVFISIVLPLAMHFVFRSHGISIIKGFVSVEVVCLFTIFLLRGIVSNSIYCISFFGCLVLSFVLYFVFHIKLTFNSSKDTIIFARNNWKILALLPFLALIYFPSELYFMNVSEFSNNYLPFICILVMSAVLLSAILLVVISIVPAKWSRIVGVCLFALSLCCYLQGTFLDNILHAMEGGDNRWSAEASIGNLVLWSVILVVTLIISVKIKDAMKYMNYVAAFLLIVLSLTLIVLIIQNVSVLTKEGGAITNESALVLAADENVVVFILDMTDTADMERLLRDNPKYAEPLSDFTFYNNVVSRHSQTYLAIPYLLTGTEWVNNSDMKYCDYAYLNDNVFIKELNENGVELGIYTDAQYIDESFYGILPNYKENVVRRSNIFNTVTTMWKTSMYKLLPLVLKNNYSYYSDEIEAMTNIKNKWDINNDVLFYNMLQEKEISVSNDMSASYKFYHMRGAHYPYYLSEDIKIDNGHRDVSWTTQTKGSMNIVYEYIRQLKEKGIYDNTTIIITADHGAFNATRSVYDIEKGSMNGPCMPIMFVKLAGQKGDALTYNEAPLSQGDMLATIAEIFGVSGSKYGAVFNSVSIDSDRARYFYDYGQGDIRVKVIGDAHDINNWTLD